MYWRDDPICFLERLEGVRPSGKDRWTARCPAHPDRNPSLSIALKDGRVLIHCFAGCDPDAVLAAVGLTWKDLSPWSPTYDRPWRPNTATPGTLKGKVPPTPDERRRKVLERLWGQSLPLDHPKAEVARRYLEARGLDLGKVLPVENLRLHPSLPYREEKDTPPLGVFPVLLARVVHPAHGLVALHRTYLHPEGKGKGKAPVPSPKKLTSPVFEGATRGAAIPLYPPEEGKPLALAEGVETALAVRELTGWPVWATVSAGGLEAVLLPSEVREVVLCADHDRRGLLAAKTLAARLLEEGRTVRVAVPPKEGKDWLDLLEMAKTGAATPVKEVEEVSHAPVYH